MVVASPHFFQLEETRLGTAAVAWRDDAAGARIVRIYLPAPAERIRRKLGRDFPGAVRKTCGAVDQLREGVGDFMAGRVVRFETAAFDMGPVPPYHRKVLAALASIPRGKVVSYGGLASETGAPGGARAAGQGCGKNPFPVVFPCHRVIRADGSLGGFGGGLPLKRALLEMEGVRFDAKGKVIPEDIIL